MSRTSARPTGSSALVGSSRTPFLGAAPLTGAYLTWAALWVALVGGLAAVSFARKDL